METPGPEGEGDADVPEIWTHPIDPAEEKNTFIKSSWSQSLVSSLYQ